MKSELERAFDSDMLGIGVFQQEWRRAMKQHYVMPVGVDDFRRVRQQYYYVDKTDFIRTLIDGHAQATLITRPRRFGKTLSLSTCSARRSFVQSARNSSSNPQIAAGMGNGMSMASSSPRNVNRRMTPA